MARALALQPVPGYVGGAKAWRRSWMLGYASAVVARVRAVEETAFAAAPGADGGLSAALVLADRALTVPRQAEQAYPRTHTGSGYADGYRERQHADIDGAKLRSRPAGPLPLTRCVRFRSPLIPNARVVTVPVVPSMHPGGATARFASVNWSPVASMVMGRQRHRA